jgi:hypothetical protein
VQLQQLFVGLDDDRVPTSQAVQGVPRPLGLQRSGVVCVCVCVEWRWVRDGGGACT